MRFPAIQFADLPRAVWQHLLERVAQRRVSLEDLQQLQAWARSAPAAPDGDWYKDFGSFSPLWKILVRQQFHLGRYRVSLEFVGQVAGVGEAGQDVFPG